MKVLDAAGNVVYEWEEPQAQSHSIGVGITTRNRWEVAAKTIAQIERLTPGAKIVVVDDASDTVEPSDTRGPGTQMYRFDANVGIARAKNKCLELLDDCEHIFLFDDDAYPTAEDWFVPYIESPEPHLMRIFLDLSGPTKLNDIKEIYHGRNHVAYTAPRGVMLYAHRSVLDAVGGMDVGFGLWGYEHGDWSNRIHNAGLTTWRFADVVDSASLIYCLDEHELVDRTVEKTQRRAAVKANLPRYQAQYDTAEYREYRETVNAILTCFYTGTPDPQRPNGKRLTPDALDALTLSTDKTVVVFTDNVKVADLEKNRTSIMAERGVYNLYIQRWIDYWQYLRDNPDIDFVWCVDGTDVEMLHSPWQQMERGVLYLGTENGLTGNEWMRRNTAPQMIQFIEEWGKAQLLNAGLVGGDRETVMEFIHDMVKLYFDNQTGVFLGKQKDITDGVNDMGILNIVGRSLKWHSRLRTGSQVNTTFKANERNDWSWWKHK